MTEVTPPTDGLQTLDRALAILNLFQVERDEWSAAEAAEELGLGLGTVSRFMRGLAARGFLSRSGRRYRLGFAAIELGHRATASLHLRDRLRPVTVQLARSSGETCVLLELTESGGEARVVDRAESGTGIRISVSIGHQLPLTRGFAKVLLAHTPPDLRESAVGEKIDEELARSLDEILEKGWALSYEEVEPGAWGISAAIVAPGGEPLGAFGLVAPTARFSEDAQERLVELLRPAVVDAGERLGMIPTKNGD